MSKLLKICIIFVYTYLLFQYLIITLSKPRVDIDLKYVIKTPAYFLKQEKLFKAYRKNISVYLKSYKKPIRFNSDLKFILKYTSAFLHFGTPLYKNGQRPFFENNCSYYNCYLTTDIKTLGDIRDFDAVIFEVENSWDAPDIVREPYQKFVFMATEAAANYPLCDKFYDNFYNLTWTYRLDSDIRWSYLSVLDLEGNFVGPKINMKWIDPMEPTPADVKKKLRGKTKAAAWFVSNCNAASGRQNVTDRIQEELAKYNLAVDIYGWCGKKKCPKDRINECLDLLQSDYYFYLSFENSLCEDYVTEKILYPLQNYAVPIVFGGANYSWFLPPDSYIDAMALNATEVVNKMMEAIKDPEVYENYFRWRNHYKYVRDPPDPDICKLCQVLNEEADKRFTHFNFRRWWNPDHLEFCQQGVGRYLVMKSDHLKGKLEPIDIVKKPKMIAESY